MGTRWLQMAGAALPLVLLVLPSLPRTAMAVGEPGAGASGGDNVYTDDSPAALPLSIGLPPPPPGPVYTPCERAIETYCGSQAGTQGVCMVCAGLHQQPLRAAGCTHAMINKWCSHPMGLDMPGWLCNCPRYGDPPHRGDCTPLMLRGIDPAVQRDGRPDVVVQIGEDDAGHFDPLEEGRIDWNITTVLVSASRCTHRTGTALHRAAPPLSLALVLAHSHAMTDDRTSRD